MLRPAVVCLDDQQLQLLGQISCVAVFASHKRVKTRRQADLTTAQRHKDCARTTVIESYYQVPLQAQATTPTLALRL